MSQFFPPFTVRHYSYLRDVHPLLVPKLVFLEKSENVAESEKNENDSINFLNQRLQEINTSNSEVAMKSALTTIKRMLKVWIKFYDFFSEHENLF